MATDRRGLTESARRASAEATETTSAGAMATGRREATEIARKGATMKEKIQKEESAETVSAEVAEISATGKEANSEEQKALVRRAASRVARQWSPHSTKMMRRQSTQ